ncbi:MAG: hypothetical protein GX442_09335 [Candidatus Riflebacteria bacterium]|nr:hypothetical protein [Candidatus Riflebacteria bacterium]
MLFNLVAGGAAFLLGVLLLYFSAVQRTRVQRYQQLRRWSARELAEQPPPDGTVLEIGGRIVCDSPITAAQSRQACVFFLSQVRERVEETTVQENRRTGRPDREVRTFHRNLEEFTDRVPFQIDDGTGRVGVDPFQAAIEGKRVVDRFQVASAAAPPLPAPAGAAGAPPPAGSLRILGTRHDEVILAPDQTVTVFGAFVRRDGQPWIQKGATPAGLFLITPRTRDEVTAEAAKAMRFWLIAGTASCLFGVVAFLLGFR